MSNHSVPQMSENRRRVQSHPGNCIIAHDIEVCSESFQCLTSFAAWRWRRSWWQAHLVAVAQRRQPPQSLHLHQQQGRYNRTFGRRSQQGQRGTKCGAVSWGESNFVTG